MEELQKRLQQLSEEYQKLQTGTAIHTLRHHTHPPLTKD